MGHELVAFRDAAGTVRVLDAICPHFGAHLGHGEVVGGNVRCPFHKLDFDGTGRCAGAAAHYDPARVRHLRTRAWACRERFGMIFVWNGPDPARPAWEMPLDALDWEGWTSPVTNDGIPMPGVQPMWVAENIADIAHLRTVHCWDLREVVEPPREHRDGCYRVVVDVTWRLGAMSRISRFRALGRYVNSPFRLEAKILNPGIVVAEATLTEAQGSLQVRNVVLVTPVGERDARLRILVSVRRRADGAWVRGVERLTGLRPEDLLARVMLEIGTDDFRSDAEISAAPPPPRRAHAPQGRRPARRLPPLEHALLARRPRGRHGCLMMGSHEQESFAMHAATSNNVTPPTSSSAHARPAPTVPYRLPWVGSAIELGRDPDAFIDRCVQRHGSAFAVLLPGGPRTFLTDPFDFSTLFHTKELVFRDIADLFAGRVFGFDPTRLDEDIVTALVDSTHTQLKRPPRPGADPRGAARGRRRWRRRARPRDDPQDGEARQRRHRDHAAASP